MNAILKESKKVVKAYNNKKKFINNLQKKALKAKTGKKMLLGTEIKSLGEKILNFDKRIDSSIENLENSINKMEVANE